MDLDPWTAIKTTASSVFTSSDTNYAKIVAAKKALQLLGGDSNSNSVIKLCLAAADGDNFIIKDLLSNDSTILNALDKSGLTPLIYGVCFNKVECVELLINFNVDCNQPDEILGWTPIMWATYLNLKDMVTTLLNGEADPYLKPSKSGKNAIDLAIPGTSMYDFFLEHNLIKSTDREPIEDITDNFSYNNNNNVSTFQEHDQDDLQAQIKLQSVGISGLMINDQSEDNIYHTATFNNNNISSVFDNNPLEYNDIEERFDFTKISPKQFVKFHDGGIMEVLDYVFNLYNLYPHKTTLPAAIIYQCLRYAESKLESSELVETFFNLFLTKVRSITNSKSGVPSLSNSKGDIVMISYWLSVVNFVYYYLYRDSACKFFIKYPQFLQDLISTLQSLIAELAFAINNRLDDLIDICVLDYTNLADSKNVAFKNEWHLFKRKFLKNKSTYDDILEMLYPPPPKEQMKPSPIKITQTLGALLYVLDLHRLTDVTRQQTLSAVLYWFGASLFNRLLANKNYHSRTRAMQIRLNLSVIEDWLRTNDFKPDIVDPSFMKDKEFPETIINKKIKLNNVAKFNENINDPNDSTFYYNSLFKIGKHHLMPAVELLEWLQVMTSLADIKTLNKTLSSLITLNPIQLLKIVKTYRYEIEELKFPKELTFQLKQINDSKKFIIPSNLYFFNNSKSEDHLFLNPDHLFPVVLSNIQQLIKRYGSGLSGLDDKRSKEFQPLLPITIIDALDEIYDETGKDNDEYDNGEGLMGTSLDNDEANHFDETPLGGGSSNDQNFKGGDLFKEVQIPSSLAHKTWGEIEDNPW
ncbi:hypothetical protein PACTADRAFT_48736 [Pachysolen tannophilus NRRL Y-2460]|uniref:Dilute domain-containing protein n=1 Tax=Pachysolen tannophilus NRRL Y-2460 TaxID=669874 RepID=A0A1E4TYX9_PACTA|nr:hypothetical protein PACTADRAFT_48736 [Pachysolen tannophilus NRRL Y-2460]